MKCQLPARTFPPLAHRVASDIGTRAVDKAWKSPTRLARASHTKPGRVCPLDFGAKTAPPSLEFDTLPCRKTHSVSINLPRQRLPEPFLDS
jgi:hypothetical protein